MARRKLGAKMKNFFNLNEDSSTCLLAEGVSSRFHQFPDDFSSASPLFFVYLCEESPCFGCDNLRTNLLTLLGLRFSSINFSSAFSFPLFLIKKNLNKKKHRRCFILRDILACLVPLAFFRLDLIFIRWMKWFSSSSTSTLHVRLEYHRPGSWKRWRREIS